MPVTVRDLEVAQVLAREVKAAAARSAGASLRADQVKLLFGATELDRTERERIQAALEMVGLDPQPSLLEVDGDAAVAFVARPAGSFPPQRRRRFSAGETPTEPARAPGEFPTVGEFARSTFERARRRLAERDDAAPPAETNGAPAPAPPAEADHLDFDYVPPAPDPHVNGSAAPESPAVESEGTEAPLDEADLVVAAEPEHGAAGERERQPAASETEPEPVAAAPEPDSVTAQPEPDSLTAQPESEPLAAAEADGADMAPLAVPEDPPRPAAPEPEPAEPLHVVAPAPTTDEPAAPPRRAEIAAVIAAAAILPVIGTSIAGWQFGLPYLALALAATGWLAAKDRAEGGSGGGVVAAVRSSPLAHGALRATALLTIVSVVAAVLLAAASTSRPTAARATPAALGDWMRPVTANARSIRATAHRRRPAHRAVKHHPAQAPPPPTTTTATAPTTQAPAPTTPAPSSQAPPAGSSGTQGLYEVPAQSAR